MPSFMGKSFYFHYGSHASDHSVRTFRKTMHYSHLAASLGFSLFCLAVRKTVGVSVTFAKRIAKYG